MLTPKSSKTKKRNTIAYLLVQYTTLDLLLPQLGGNKNLYYKTYFIY